jgi:hypothetical protein
VSLDEVVRPATRGHAHPQPQPPQSDVLATTCTVLEVIPEKKLAFRVNTNHSIWSYELERNGESTRVIESRHAENGVAAVSHMTINAFFGGTTNFESELIDGMKASLANIKAAAENN